MSKYHNTLPAASPTPNGDSAARSGRILIAEDDAVLREILAEGLRSEGYRVGCAEDGEAGWAALCADSFDLLITDHDMPRLSGLDLLRRVRAGPLKLPVILISGKMPWDAPDFLELLPPGTALEKPFSLADLVVKVRAILPSRIRASEHAGEQSLLTLARQEVAEPASRLLSPLREAGA